MAKATIIEDSSASSSNEDNLGESRQFRRPGLVKFPSTKEKMEQIRRRSALSRDQISNLWLDFKEFRSLRSQIHELKGKHKDRGYSKLLAAATKDTNDNMSQMKLDLWAKVDNEDLNLRGLEREVSSEHRAWRDQEQKRAVRAVLEAQELARSEAQELRDVEDFSEYIASISQAHTANSKEFAHMMAKADHKAVGIVNPARTARATPPSSSSSSSTHKRRSWLSLPRKKSAQNA